MKSSRFPFTSFPNGWFCIASSDELHPGDVKPLHYFGKDLVLFRTEDGTAHVFDAHCPHLGAHLGYGGTVNKQSIQCPFHGWCFDGKGECVDIPYASKIPPQAKVRTYPVQEVNGLIMVYYHAQGETPTWEIPELPEYSYEEWSPLQTVHRFKLRTHCQEIGEGIVDAPHFSTVHGLGTSASIHKIDKFEIEGVICKTRLWTKYYPPFFLSWILGNEVKIVLDFTKYGLGYSINFVSSEGQIKFHLLSLGFYTPIDEEYCDFHQLVSMKFSNKLLTHVMTPVFAKDLDKSTKQDILIWENKIFSRHTVLCENDGPIAQYRRWASQFYTSIPGISTASHEEEVLNSIS